MKQKNLIIDDDEIALMLAEMLVGEDLSFQNTIKFLDGAYALEYLKREYNKDTIYAILLDINMPLMDGWEFLENIKPFVSVKNTYVFILSSSSDKTDIKKSDKFNLVKGYFTKPLQKKHLEHIRDVVSRQ